MEENEKEKEETRNWERDYPPRSSAASDSVLATSHRGKSESRRIKKRFGKSNRARRARKTMETQEESERNASKFDLGSRVSLA